jgi:hypothetical protein
MRRFRTNADLSLNIYLQSRGCKTLLYLNVLSLYVRSFAEVAKVSDESGIAIFLRFYLYLCGERIYNKKMAKPITKRSRIGLKSFYH